MTWVPTSARLQVEKVVNPPRNTGVNRPGRCAQHPAKQCADPGAAKDGKR